METVQEYQPDVDIGAKVLLQNLEEPHFTENLLNLQTETPWSPLNFSLQEIEPGRALPVWGAGTNKPTQAAKDFIEEIFIKGQKTKPMMPSEVVEMMKEATDPITGASLFDENSYLDKDQIKGIFASLSKERKRDTSAKGKAKQKQSL